MKAIIPLFNYDGEPSVSKGIMSQLPSSHLSIHQVPAKLSNRVYALRRELPPATALVCLWYLLTDPQMIQMVPLSGGRNPSLHKLVVVCRRPAPTVFGLPSGTLPSCRTSFHSSAGSRKYIYLMQLLLQILRTS